MKKSDSGTYIGYSHKVQMKKINYQRPKFGKILLRLTGASGIAMLAFSAVSYGGSIEFKVAESDHNLVRFESTAKLEFVAGETTDIRGKITFDPHDLTANLSGTLSVDLTTLKTGIELRDEHMRERNLQTREFPVAKFDLVSVEGLPKDITLSDSAQAATFKGRFTIHGVTREIEAKGKVRYSRVNSTSENEFFGDSLIIAVKFQIRLDDYEIPRPRALFLKLAETIEIEVKATLLAGNRSAS